MANCGIARTLTRGWSIALAPLPSFIGEKTSGSGLSISVSTKTSTTALALAGRLLMLLTAPSTEQVSAMNVGADCCSARVRVWHFASFAAPQYIRSLLGARRTLIGMGAGSLGRIDS